MILELCQWLEATPLATAITESESIFPTIETVHVFGLAVVFGSIAMLDLRLLGVANTRLSVLRMTHQTLPWTWSAFLVCVVTGALMFISAATKYYGNIPFRIKLVLLALAGVNMMVFHLTGYRNVAQWSEAPHTPPASARVAAAISLATWTAVIFAGRWIGFV